MAPSELTVSAPEAERVKRPTASYSDGSRRPVAEAPRRDTRYSVNRAGVRDEIQGAERFPVAPLASPPPVSLQEPGLSFESTPGTQTQTQLLGRLARQPAGQPVQNKTVFGVAAAPSEIDIELGSMSAPLPGAGDDPRDERPITATGTASPPPVPRPNQRPGAAGRPPPTPPQATAILPSIRRAPEPPPQPPGPAAPQPIPISGWLDAPQPPPAFDRRPADSAAETRPDAWVAKNPATTQPMSPTTPIAPPTAPTMIAVLPDPLAAASTARGMGAATIVAEPSPATTARGFQPPQTYPIQPQTYPVQPGYVPPPAPPPPVYAPPPAPAVPPPAPVLLEVTPRGLGIATVAGFCEELIRRNARVPTEARKLFTTSRDHQDMVRIVVCQGESRRLDSNTVIGDLVLQNLPPRPRGETSIEVTFALDASGVLHVRALDAETGAEQRATLSLVGGVAQEDVAASRDRLAQLRR
jgi:hypothetical protein